MFANTRPELFARFADDQGVSIDAPVIAWDGDGNALVPNYATGTLCVAAVCADFKGLVGAEKNFG